MAEQPQPARGSSSDKTTEADRLSALDAAYERAVDRQQLYLADEEAAFRQRQAHPEPTFGFKIFPSTANKTFTALKQSIQYLAARRRAITSCLIALPVIGLLLFACTLYLPAPTMHYSYAKNMNCVVSPSFLPAAYTSDSRATFASTHPASLSLFGQNVFSYHTCTVPLQEFKAQATYANKQTISILGLHTVKAVDVATDSFPAITPIKLHASALLLLQPAKFTLSVTDKTFDYALSANGKSADCSKSGITLTCDVRPLQLAYGTDYQLTMQRLFHRQTVGPVLNKAVKTITATSLVQPSIAAGSTVYDTPQQITFTATKPLRSLGTVSLLATINGATTTLPVQAKFSGSTVTVQAKNALPRRASIALHISQLTATDQSQLEQPYTLSFTTSGGPKVIATNLSSLDVTPNPLLTVSFDQDLLPTQDSGSLATLTVNGAKVAARYSIVSSKLTIAPINSFATCAHITLQINNTVLSKYDITGDSAWQMNARARCYTTSSIGTSVNGRPITAYQFGSGSNMVLYIGAMHGNEQNSMLLLQKWIAALIGSPDNVPAGRTIVVIPSINPDGVAAGTRENAHHIDLNRNFPSNDWRTVVTEPASNGAPTNEGGPSSLSEPESQALAAFIQANHPRLMLTYHSHAGIVEANDAADSDSLGTAYARSSGYRATPTYAIGNTFDYSTTGAAEDWMHDKLGLPALVVELRSATADEFSLNQAAMWSMARLPL